jgi:hypothetical protein
MRRLTISLALAVLVIVVSVASLRAQDAMPYHIYLPVMATGPQYPHDPILTLPPCWAVPACANQPD